MLPLEWVQTVSHFRFRRLFYQHCATMFKLWFIFCPNNVSSDSDTKDRKGVVELSAQVYVKGALEVIKEKYKEELEGIALTMLTLCDNSGRSFHEKAIISAELLVGSFEQPLILKFSPVKQSTSIKATNRRTTIFDRVRKFFFGSSADQRVLQTLEDQRVLQTLDAITLTLSRLQDHLDSLNALVITTIDMNLVEISSTHSDRNLHELNFENEIALHYKCAHPTNANLRRCVVTNHFHPVQYISKSAHILPLSQRNKMGLLSMSSADVWSWRNGWCIHKEIDKRFKALDLVVMYDYLADSFRIQVLYDDVLPLVIPGLTRGHLDGTHSQDTVTFANINGRELTFPQGVAPFHRVVLFHAHSAYKLALKSATRSHTVATNSAFSTEEWMEIFECVPSVAPVESPMMVRFKREIRAQSSGTSQTARCFWECRAGESIDAATSEGVGSATAESNRREGSSSAGMEIM